MWIYPKLAIVPWTYGSGLLHEKREAILSEPGKYNSLIIGSSRVYRQIDPLLLDSVVGEKLNLSTYNLGVNWLFAPETFYVLDQLTQTDNLKINCAVIELSKIRSIDFTNLHTARIKYWYSLSNYLFTIRSVAGSNFSFIEKSATIVLHTVSYIGKLINLGYLTEAFAFKTNINNADKNSETGKNGFLPLNISGNDSSEENALARHQLFLSDTASVTRRMNTSINQFQKFDQNSKLLNSYNKFYAGKLNEMILKHKNNGTHLVFVLSPRIDENQYNELIPLFNQINAAHRIELSDAGKYPQFYMAINSFDETHLNEKGAALYTTLLATKLKALLEKGN